VFKGVLADRLKLGDAVLAEKIFPGSACLARYEGPLRT